MKNLFVLSLFLILLSNITTAQKSEVKVVFYNTENLYDTIDNPNKDDNEFLPASKKEWNTKKYFKKIENISKVIATIDSANLPAIVGMAEVENEIVLDDLIKSNTLKKASYNYIFRESSDKRGISVALIYKPALLTVISVRNIKIEKKKDTASSDELREILYVKGVFNKKDTLNIFVNHWKSRIGGDEATEPLRIKSALTLKRIVDSLFNRNQDANIIIMGDFNDNPDNNSVYKHLAAQKPSEQIQKKTLYNVLMIKYLSGDGTLFYKKWDMFDQIIVSASLYQQKTKSIHINTNDCGILKKSWMLYKDKNGNVTPSKTFSGNNYFSGYSDHLPVYITLIY